jgi:hypothetical protein
MRSDSINQEVLRQMAEEHFGSLLARGFRFIEGGASDGPTLAIVLLAGTKVALRLSYDRRDRACDLRVAKMEDDPADLSGMDLGTYLRVYCGYRGGYSDGMTPAQLKALTEKDRLARDVRWYAGIIQAHAPRIMDDSEDFVRSPPR